MPRCWAVFWRSQSLGLSAAMMRLRSSMSQLLRSASRGSAAPASGGKVVADRAWACCRMRCVAPSAFQSRVWRAATPMRSARLRSSRTLPGKYIWATASRMKKGGSPSSFIVPSPTTLCRMAWKMASLSASPRSSRLGICSSITARRKNRSARKRPSRTSPRSGLLVAATSRKSSRTAAAEPSRVMARSSSTRSSLTCWYSGRSAISSRNSVPPLARSR